MKKKTQTFELKQPVYIISSASLAGKKEGVGPLKNYYDKIAENDTMGEKTFEKAEREMFYQTASAAIRKADKKFDEIDLMLSGDLTNQIVSSSYCAGATKIPFIGLYSACATFAGSLGLGASLISGNLVDTTLCMSGSHFSTAERQYRYPLEFGNQRQTYSQWTVTGVGACVLSKLGGGVKITKVCFGKVIDFGVKDIANMGAAMAPAAMDTLCAFFDDTGTKPDEYDVIATGDLGKLGSDILIDLMKEKGYELGQNYIDCGNMVFSSMEDCMQGGSGAGCSAIVFNSYFIKKLKEKRFKKMLLVSTGALMSTTTNQQGETIPCTAHLVEVCV